MKQVPLKPRSVKEKRVTFELQQTAYFAAPPSCGSRSLCWYTEDELQRSRDEARKCIVSLQQRLNEEGDHQASLSVDSLVITSPQDPSQILCLRGIEKYADAAAKFLGQKRHVFSILYQQSLNNKEEHLALVSRTLSEPFKEVARYYAVKSAEEQAALRKQEKQGLDEKQKEVADAVMVLLSSSKSNVAVAQPQNGRSTPPEMVATNKRSRMDCGGTNFDENGFERIVKPCMRQRIIAE